MASKVKAAKNEKVVQFIPKASAVAVGSAFPKNVGPMGTNGKPSKSENTTWEALMAVSNEIANFIAQMANDINESVELVKRVGCEHLSEFNDAVIKTNQDFEKFIADYNRIKARHEAKTGYIETPDDTALSLSIFEDYNQFHAYFNGVMHHTLISFTEYALEAQDRLVKQEAQEKKEENNG